MIKKILIFTLAFAVFFLTGCQQATEDSPFLVSIAAVYTGATTVYPDTSLDTFKTDLVVTATDSDRKTKTLAAEDYTLSGALAVGLSMVTVTYQGEKDTFMVTVNNPPPLEDPFIGVDNPFIGTWQTGTTEYWQFRTDGTGSKVTKGNGGSEKGPFLDDFSFFVYVNPTSGVKTLVMMSENNEPATIDADPLTFSRYTFVIVDDEATLTPVPAATDITLERLSGSPQPLSLKNPIIGEWLGDWDGPHGFTWSTMFRADGTAKAHNIIMGHQSELAYALRGDVLVLFGGLRYGNPVTSRIRILDSGKFEARETKTFGPVVTPGKANWLYTKVDSAPWLP